MTTFNLSVIHLGNVGDLDPVDGNATAENQSELLGTYYSAADPASDHIASISADDANEDGLINTNDRPDAEDVTFDIGGGPVATQYDSLFNANVTVTFPPGTGQPDYNGLGGIIQTETGDLFFVMIDDGEGFGSNPFDDFPIESITVNSISAFGSQQMAGVSDSQSFVPCFTTGTRILTPRGPVAVEALRVGDQVVTMDNGVQVIRWTGTRRICADQLALRPRARPIRIKAGALGPGYPASDLVVSPQHRFLLASKITARVADAPQVLVAAAKLEGLPGIRRCEAARSGVQYHHFACEGHEVVWANGAPAETFLVGPELDKAMRADCYGPLASIWPDLALSQAGPRVPARRILDRGRVLRPLLDRHLRHAKPLFSI
ncbi:Hint domain-containing protein [uncultured Tateyamaria sp.]|uniref:Hint domain-containing protein n=1 Tax=uncultured Tateyamaria sp. TaxID=455651 RepID=UPI002638AC9B|nr:Hint domain-containing protein [uncultured Tateyamaria sp.]